MDHNQAKDYIEDVLRALGQMDHRRGLEGKMIMPIDVRQNLITRGVKLTGLFENRQPYFAVTVRADGLPIDQQSDAFLASKSMNKNEIFLSFVTLACFIMSFFIGAYDAPVYYMAGMFCLYGLIWGRVVKESKIKFPSKKIPISEVIRQIQINL